MRSWWLLVISALAACLFGANCIPPVTTDPTVNPVEHDKSDALLRGFDSSEDMRAYMASQAKALYGGQAIGGGLWSWVFSGMGGITAAPAMEDAASDDANGAGGRDYSTTNIQEEGVDESDIIKNNGEYIYMLSGDSIHVLKATPPESMAEVAVIAVEPGGASMYLRDNKLIVLSQTYAYWHGGWGMDDGVAVDAAASTSTAIAIGPGVPWQDRSTAAVAILDVTDPANPAPVKVFRFEGSVVSSRLIEGKLHLVLSAQPALPANLTPAALEAMTIEEWVPDVQVVSSDGSAVEGDVVGWEGALRPETPNGYAMTVVATIDVDNPDAELKTTAVTANVGTIYASTEALYLTDTQYSWDQSASYTNTMLHKLAFTQDGTDYVASGLVPGRPLSQYSMGEHEGYLRIATTNEEFTAQTADISSGVYVLGVNGAALEIVGEVEGIAPGEQIYAARFMGDRGFLVTFKRIDPLFTMDLSDPANPAVVGELKVPGYSDHIQFLDDNHLLTIGRETEDSGSFAWVQGVLLTIFDITDMANPKVLEIGDTPARVEIGGRGTYSEANSDPKAFNYFAAKDALAFPIDLYDGDTTGAEYGQHSFTGLYVYRVTVENGFEFLGRIASTEGATQNGCYQGYYGRTRGVFIGDYVYSVTESGAKAALLDSVSTVAGNVTFSGAASPVVDCFWPIPQLSLPPSNDLR